MIARAIQRFRRAGGDSRELLFGSALAFAIKIVAAGLAFGMNVIVARQLGIHDAGLFFLGYTVIFIAASIGRLGLENTVVRFVAAFQADNDRGGVKGVYFASMFWASTASALLAILCYFMAEWLADSVFGKEDIAGVVRAFSFAIVPLALVNLNAKALQGKKRIWESMTVLSVLVPAGFVSLMLIFSADDAAAAARYFAWSNVAALMIGSLLWLRSCDVAKGALRVDRHALLASCLPLLAVVVLNLAVNWSAQLMLGMWSDSADVALFNAAQRTAMLISFGFIAVNSIAAPKLAAMCRQQNDKVLRRTLKNTARLTSIFALAPLCVMLIFPDVMLGLFGAEFSAASDALRILALGHFIGVSVGSVGLLLSMSGHEALLRNNVAIAAAVTLSSGLLLVPFFGVTGAAVSTALGVALQNGLCAIQVRRIFGFNVFSVWGLARSG